MPLSSAGSIFKIQYRLFYPYNTSLLSELLCFTRKILLFSGVGFSGSGRSVRLFPSTVCVPFYPRKIPETRVLTFPNISRPRTERSGSDSHYSSKQTQPRKPRSCAAISSLARINTPIHTAGRPREDPRPAISERADASGNVRRTGTCGSGNRFYSPSGSANAVHPYSSAASKVFPSVSWLRNIRSPDTRAHDRPNRCA